MRANFRDYRKRFDWKAFQKIDLNAIELQLKLTPVTNRFPCVLSWNFRESTAKISSDRDEQGREKESSSSGRRGGTERVGRSAWRWLLRVGLTRLRGVCAASSVTTCHRGLFNRAVLQPRFLTSIFARAFLFPLSFLIEYRTCIHWKNCIVGSKRSYSKGKRKIKKVRVQLAILNFRTFLLSLE